MHELSDSHRSRGRLHGGQLHGIPALIFCAPNYGGEAIRQAFHLSDAEVDDLEAAEAYVRSCPGEDLIGMLCNQYDKHTYGCVLAWDGYCICSNNT